MGQSLKQALIGAAIGSVLSLGVARVVAANVQGMPVFDVFALVGGFAVVVSACLAAALIPARRAALLDPTIALRQD